MPLYRRCQLADLADEPLAASVLQTFSRTLRVSVSVIALDGTIVCQALTEKHDLHSLSCRNPDRFLPLVATLSDTPATYSVGGGGAFLIVFPVRPEGNLAGAVVSGPFWRKHPTPEQVAELLASPAPRRRVPARLVVGAPCLSRVRQKHLETTLGSLAGVLSHMCVERCLSQRTVETLSTLNRIGVAVSSSLTLSEVLEEVLDGAIRLLDAEEGSVMLIDEGRDVMSIVASRGLASEIVMGTRVTVGDGISGEVAREGRARLLCSGVRAEASRLDVWKAAICVPLVTNGEVIGVLNLRGRRNLGDPSPDFTHDDVSVLSVMASQAAGAIANAKAYEAAHARAGEMSALYSIGTLISSGLERNQLLGRVLNHATRFLDCKEGSIMLVGPESHALQVEVSTGLSEGADYHAQLLQNQTIACEVAREGQPRLVKTSEAVGENDTRQPRAAMYVPLTLRDRVVGVIHVSNRVDGNDFTPHDLEVLSMLANQAAVALENSSLHNELHELFVSSITALANAIDARDPYTRGHSERVAQYAVRLGERLGMDQRELDFLQYAALLHDVGKIHVRDEILNKPGRLTSEEFAVMKRHPEYGAAIMTPVRAFQKIIPFMFYHHEKYDQGGGYPIGLSGQAIPREARIIAIVDAYDAMTSNRPYRNAMAVEEATRELLRYAGTQFDPALVDAFLHLLQEDPVLAHIGTSMSRDLLRPGTCQPAPDRADTTTAG